MSDLAQLIDKNRHRFDLDEREAEVEVGMPEVLSGSAEEGMVSPLRAVATQLRDEQQAAVRASMNQALDQNPDQFVEDKQIAEQTHAPVETVQRNREQYKKKKTIADLDLNKMLAETPALSQMLQDREFAAAAHDDIDALTALEAAAQPFRSFAAGFPGFFASAYDALATPFDLLSEASAALDRATGGNNEGLDPAGEVSAFLRGISKGQRDFAARIRGDVSEYSPTAQSAFSGFESTGRLLPALVASLLTGNPAFLYGGAAVSAGGDAVSEGRKQGLPASQATMYGLADAGVEVATELIPALKLLGDLTIGSSLFKTLYNQLITEIPQEQLATVLQDANAQIFLPENRDKTFIEYLEERPGAAYHTLIATLTGTASQTTIAHTANKTFNLLNEKAEAARLKQRSPEQFRAYLKKVLDGGEVEDVHIESEKFVQYFQEAGIDPFDPANKSIFESLGVVDQLDKASENVGDVIIPLESYITNISGTEHHDALAPHLRFRVDDWSTSEADAVGATDPDFMASLQQEAETLRKQVEEDGASDETYEYIKQQLIATGMDIDTAATNAALYRALTNTAYARYGVSPEELMGHFGLRIQRVFPEDLQQKTPAELDVLVEQIAQPSPTPATRKIYGPSLLEFLAERGGVTDDGGEMSHRDAQQWHVDKPGQKRLVRDDGEGLDGAAQAAWEAGYIPGVSYEELTQDNLLEAMDRELGGDVVYSEQNMDVAAATQLENRNQLIEFLESVGIDTSQTDRDVLREEVRKALYSGQEGALLQQTRLQEEQQRWKRSLQLALEKGSADFSARFSTPAVLKAFGFKPKMVELPYRVLQEVGRRHPDIPEEVFFQLPTLISNPLYLYPHGNGLRIVLDAKTKSGEPIAVGVRLTGNPRITTVTPIHNNPGRRGVTRARHQFKDAAFSGKKVYARDAKTLAEAKVLTNQDSDRGTIPQSPSRLSNNILTRIDLVNWHGREFFQAEMANRQLTGLYSAVEQAIIDMPLPAWKGSKRNPEGRANGTDIWAKLRGMPNIGKEETKWLGIEEYLESGKYTRDEVLAFVRNNGVRLEETVADMSADEAVDDLTWDREADTDPENWRYRIDDLMDDYDRDPHDLYWFSYEDAQDRAITAILESDEAYIREALGDRVDRATELTESMEAIQWVREEFASAIDTAVRSQAEEEAEETASREYLDDPYYLYTAQEVDDVTIYGNEDIGYSHLGEFVSYDFDSAVDHVIEIARDNGVFATGHDETVAKWGDYVAGDGDNYREIKMKLPEVEGSFEYDIHFPDRNIVVFLRVDDQEIVVEASPETKLDVLPHGVAWMEEYGESFESYLKAQYSRVSDHSPIDGALEAFEAYKNATAKIAALEAYANPKQRFLPHFDNASRGSSRLQREFEKRNQRELIQKIEKEKLSQFNAVKRIVAYAHARFSDWMPVETRQLFQALNNAARSERNTYFVQELQSDWHQQGRQKGYATGESTFELRRQSEKFKTLYSNKLHDLDKQLADGVIPPESELAKSVRALMFNDPGTGVGVTVGYAIHRAVLGQVSKDLRNAQFKIIKSQPRLLELAELFSEYHDAQKKLEIELHGVPEAPFKTNWTALGVKRAIVDAIQGGYEAFAWVDSQVLVERYSTQYRKAYEKQYDEKMPSLVRKLTGIKPTHDEYTHTWYIEITPELRDRVVKEGFTLFQRTPEFKEWFGNSHVVDENGEPRIVYRGEHGETEDGDLQTELGAFSFGSIEAANQYAVVPNRGGEAVAPRVMPVYLSIQNPVINTPDDPFVDVSSLVDALGEEQARKIALHFAEAIESTDNWASEFQEQYGTVERLLAEAPEKITGLYFDAWRLFDVPEMVDLFREAGYDGAIHGGSGITALEPEYKVFSPEQAIPAIGGAMQQSGKKGSIQFFEGETLISLFEQSDLSTTLHESGHLFLEALGYLNDRVDDARLQQDYATTLKFLGVESREEIGIEQHEKFARAFEVYLFEGHAPSVEMQTVFQRFKAWLLNIYKHVKNLNVELSDDMREVFDRMLATDEEIAQAEKMNQFVPLFTSAEQAGITEHAFTEYMHGAERVSRQAEDELEKRKLAEVRRERTRQWRDQRKKMREEVEKEVNQMRVYQVIHFLQRGESLTGRLPEGLQPMKLDRQGIIDIYGGAEVLRLLPGRGRLLTYAREGGVHPNDLAVFFGYDTGREMVDDIIEAEKRQKHIDLLTEQRMREEHGDIYMDGRIEQEALDAIHNDKRGTFLATELRMLSKRVGTPGTPANMARAAAERVIGSQKVSKLRPGQYHAAEVRAAKAAERAIIEGDIAEAAKQKRLQLLNFYLFREARRAKEDVDKILKRLSRYTKPGTRKNLARDYLDQIDKILEKFDLKRSVSLKEIARRKAFKTFVDERQADGQEVIVTDHLQTLLEQAEKVHYKDLSMLELRGLDDTVKNIAHLARLKQKLIAGMEKRDYEDVVHRMVVTAEAEHTWHDEPVDYSEGKWKQVKKWAKAFLAEHRKLEFVFRQMDGENPNGPFWTNLFLPLANAENAELEMQQSAVEKLNAIFGRFSRRERNAWHKKIKTDNGMGVQTKASILSMALNWGNADNRVALLKGRGWSATQVEALFDKHLTKADWDFVQDILDLINSYWPQIAALEKELTGVVPQKVPPTEIKTKHGTYRGGYFPLKYDPEHSHRAFKRSEKEATEDLFESNWLKPSTKQGHTKERVGSGGQAVRLDLGVIAEHLNNVIHDVTHRKAIIQVDRLSQDKRVREAITKVAGKEVYRQIRPWLQSIASDQRLLTSVVEKIIGHVRQGATVVNMGWKVTTAIVQPLGYLQSVDILGEKWAMKGLMKFYNPARFRENIAFIMENSTAMRHRQQTFDRDVRDTLKRVTRDTAMAHLQRTFFMHIGFLDMSVSMPTWLGAYEKATAEGMSHDEAVAFADSVVRQSQSAGGAKDLADIQRGGETWRMFTMFYSYFSVLYNLMARRTQMTRENRSGPWRAFTSFMYLVVLPAVLAELITGRGPDEDDDEEWGPWVAKTAATYPFQTMVGVRDIVSGISSDYGYGFSPVAQAIEQGVTAIKSADDLFDEDEEFSKWDAKNWAMWGGYLTKLPVRQLWTSGEEVYETLAEGDDFSIWEFLIRQDPDE